MATIRPTPGLVGASVASSIHPLYTHPKPPSPRYELEPKFLVAARRSFMLKDLSPALAATSEPEKAEELPPLRRDASLAVTEAAEPELLDVVLLVTSELNEIDGPGQDSCNL